MLLIFSTADGFFFVIFTPNSQRFLTFHGCRSTPLRSSILYSPKYRQMNASNTVIKRGGVGGFVRRGQQPLPYPTDVLINREYEVLLCLELYNYP